jgi:hypothetical protein
MAQMKINAMIAGYQCQEKKDFNTRALVKDPQTGEQVYNRRMQVLDLDSEQPSIFKVNIDVSQEALIKNSLHRNGSVLCDVRQWNGNVFFDLLEFKPSEK